MPKTETPVDTVAVDVQEIDSQTTKVATLKNLAKNPRILAVAIAATVGAVAIALNSRKNDEEVTPEA
jgi:hypothetical protein